MHWREVFIRSIWWVRREKTYLKYKELLIEEKLSSIEIEALQNKRIKEFVKYCYDYVPYYKKLFDENNIDPSEIQCVNDLQKIPVLTKDIARENGEMLISKKYKDYNLKKINTSGSTGKPFTLYDLEKNRNEVLLSNLWSFYRRCGWKPGERIATIWGASKNNNDTTIAKRIKNFLMGVTYLNAWEANDENFMEWFFKLEQQSVKVLVCYASVGARFAKWMLDNNKRLTSIKGVYTTSEILLEKQQEEIEEAFKCKVYNLYGCGEVLAIACSCQNGKIHINSTKNIVELIGTNSNNSGNVVLTGFQNKIMPFLRYVNGDFISMNMNGDCECGRQSGSLGITIARSSDLFKFKNGKVYASLYFILRLYKQGFEGIELFQFHQKDYETINLKILKNSKFNEETFKLLNDLSNEIEAHIHYQAKVNIMFVEKVDFGEGLKHFYAKSDVKS